MAQSAVADVLAALENIPETLDKYMHLMKLSKSNTDLFFAFFLHCSNTRAWNAHVE